MDVTSHHVMRCPGLGGHGEAVGGCLADLSEKSQFWLCWRSLIGLTGGSSLTLCCMILCHTRAQHSDMHQKKKKKKKAVDKNKTTK